MKKAIFTSLILILAISACCLLHLMGCHTVTHIHSYTKQIAEPVYLESCATCTNKSKYYYSCACGAIGNQTFEYGQINPDNHVFNQCKTKPKYLKSAATCTDKAKYYYSCACGEIGTEVFDYGNAIGHIFNSYTVNSKATCSSDEIQIAICENCSATNTKTIFGTKLPHNFLNSICVDCDFTYLNLSLKNDGTYNVDGIKNEMADLAELEIPSQYKNISVTSISDNAFSHCTSLSKVVINEGITSIGKEAFKNCYSLTSVVIPSTITTIESYAFKDCYRLVELYNLSSLDITTGSSSYGGIGLHAISIHNSNLDLSKIEKVNDYIFYSGEKNYLIDYKGTSKHITLPDNYNQENYEILNYAFFNKSTLTSITVPNSLEIIGFSAFSNCNKLEKISVPFIGESRNPEVNSYLGFIFGASTKSENSKFIPQTLTHITLTDEKIIKQSAFENCNNIRTIILSEGLETIERWAFYDCSNLSYISIPNTVNSIGSSILQNTALYNNDDNWKDDVLYIDKCLIQAKRSLSGKYNIKQGTKIVAKRAFEFCENLTEVILPDSVDIICEAAFYSCKKLENLLIPNSVTNLGDSLFNGCYALTNVTLPNNLKSIPNYFFSGCSNLQHIELPNSIISIGNSVFGECKSLSDIIIPSNVTSIGNSAFSGCIGLKSITLPINLTDISDNLFYGCTGLENIVIPQNINTIGQSAFYGCINLNNVIISNGVTKISALAFYGCSNIESVYIPKTIIEIEWAAFIGCSKLSSATFEVASGWALTPNVELSTTKIELATSILSNSNKAAEYLISNTYSLYFNWQRNEILPNKVIDDLQ